MCRHQLLSNKSQLNTFDFEFNGEQFRFQLSTKCKHQHTKAYLSLKAKLEIRYYLSKLNIITNYKNIY